MDRSHLAGRRCYAVPACAAAALLPTVLLSGCTSAPQARAAWNRYVVAEAAYEDCRSRRPPDPSSCHAEEGVLETDRARYHAAADAQR